jgi:hypothetical protein
MTDAPEDLTIVYLYSLDEKMDRVLDGLGEHGRRIKLFENRLTALHGDFAGQSLRMERIEQRLDRIERRLERLPAGRLVRASLESGDLPRISPSLRSPAAGRAGCNRPAVPRRARRR